MGIFMDMHQYRKIAQAQAEAAQAGYKAEAIDHRLNELERRVDRLALACQALWEIIKEKNGITEEQIFERMEEIDLRNGKSDGKVGSQILKCQKCGRNINTQRPVCVYCGHKNICNDIVH